METAAIITTDASRALRGIHHRMPVVVAPDAFEFWLDPKVDADTAAALLVPAPEDFFDAHEVSLAVNRTVNDGPELIAPFTPPPLGEPVAPSPGRAKSPKKDARQQSLF
jgi:putative SOS response-associated peptidase YedK